MPKVFTWMDFLTFGMAAIVATVLTAIVQFNGLNPDVPTWRWIGIWSVAVLFWLGYIRVVVWRWQLVKRFAFVAKPGLIFIKDGGQMPTKDAVETYLVPKLAPWLTDTGEFVFGDVWVFVKPLPFTNPKTPTALAGMAKPASRRIAVGFDGRHVAHTAIVHELCHVYSEFKGLPQDHDSIESLERSLPEVVLRG